MISLCSNYRYISLINMGVKFVKAALAHKLYFVLLTTEQSVQAGFVHVHKNSSIIKVFFTDIYSSSV